MNKENIYVVVIGVLAVAAFVFAITHLPESMLQALKSSGL